ncbi:MucB/RseB C-terminal domain-containing protein [Microbulbifer sp. SAOS-129_SWC]|uniref:MucB/RseB C-terminal domain-containing protein n=1 Tax=Microbulbifer sp. SAOS-129_SWC TaxID=3145235 RepID=UPI003216B8F1
MRKPLTLHPAMIKANSLLLALFLLAPAVRADDKATAVAVAQPAVAGAQQQPEVQQGGAASSPAAAAQRQPQSVEDWLAKLNRAANDLEYSGLATFEHGGMLETLEVVHALRDGEQVERVRYLSGDPRELISHGSSRNCARLSNPLARAGLLSGAGHSEVERSYQFVLRGEERVADRDTVVIEARPRDLDRLGMVINLDRKTGLPLKSMLVNAQGRVLERYQFVKLNLSPVPDSALEPSSADARRIDNNTPCTSAQSRWQVRWVPEGFELVSVRTLSDGDMLVFSDGLSVFTVFVQHLGPGLDFQGRAIRGATVAYMDKVRVNGVDYTVTVVGEIPDTTARRVAGAVGIKG